MMSALPPKADIRAGQVTLGRCAAPTCSHSGFYPPRYRVFSAHSASFSMIAMSDAMRLRVAIAPTLRPAIEWDRARLPSPRANTERASSSGFMVLLPTNLSVSHASSKAVSKSRRSEDRRSCCGSCALPQPPTLSLRDLQSFGADFAEFVT